MSFAQNAVHFNHLSIIKNHTHQNIKTTGKEQGRSNSAAPRTNVTHAFFFSAVSKSRYDRKPLTAKRGQSKLEMEVNAVESPAPEGVIMGGD